MKYDAMVLAIAECYRVDEVKDISDKAKALQEYFKQANNPEAEAQAGRIRLRAERRAGELLKELERMSPSEIASAGGISKSAVVSGELQQKEPPKSEYQQTLEDHNISRSTAHRMQKIAEVDPQVFEELLNDPEPQNPTKFLQVANAHKEVNQAILESDPANLRMERIAKKFGTAPKELMRVWGDLRELSDKNFISEKYIDVVASTLEKYEEEPSLSFFKEDILSIAPQVIQFYQSLIKKVSQI